MKYCLLFALLAVIPIQGFSFYKCTNEKGEVTYQKVTCPPSSAQIKKRVFIEHSQNSKSEFVQEEAIPLPKIMLFRNKLASAISSLSYLKMALSDYYSLNGNWPTKLSDAGIDKSSMTSSNIDEVSLDKEGGIVAKLNSSFGENKILLTKPKAVMGGTSMEWTCYANFPKELLSYAGESICESRILK